MRITSIDVVGRRIPFADSFPVSYGSDETTEHVFVRLETDDETIGYGEGTALPWFTGETTDGMVEIIRRWLGPLIDGAPLDDAAAAVEEFLDDFPHAAGAKSAMSLALVDLRAKRAGVPARELLGPTVRDTVPLVYLLPGIDSERAETEVRQASDEGFRRFKVKATGDIEADVDRINAVLGAIPDDATARIDANTGWRNYQTAIRAIDEIDLPEKIEYLEQPVAADRPHDMEQLWSETGISVFADESVHGPSDVERLGAEGLVAGCHLKLAKTGSLDRLAEMASIARRHALDVTVVSAFGTSLDVAANLQLAAVTPNISAACEFVPDLIDEDPATDSIDVEPSISIPDDPGLGVELREELF